jgi:hypothetical protein
MIAPMVKSTDETEPSGPPAHRRIARVAVRPEPFRGSWRVHVARHRSLTNSSSFRGRMLSALPVLDHPTAEAISDSVFESQIETWLGLAAGR